MHGGCQIQAQQTQDALQCYYNLCRIAYCGARRLCLRVCPKPRLYARHKVSAAKVMCCIQCSLVIIIIIIIIIIILKPTSTKPVRQKIL